MDVNLVRARRYGLTEFHPADGCAVVHQRAGRLKQSGTLYVFRLRLELLTAFFNGIGPFQTCQLVQSRMFRNRDLPQAFNEKLDRRAQCPIFQPDDSNRRRSAPQINWQDFERHLLCDASQYRIRKAPKENAPSQVNEFA